MATNSQSARSKSQIEADLGATRDRLAASLESLIDQVHPNRIKERSVDRLKAIASTQLENAKSLVVNARGDLRKDRLVAVAAAGGGFLAFVIIVKAIARRGRKS